MQTSHYIRSLIFALTLLSTVHALAQEIEFVFDGAEPESGLGDIGWGIAERPDGGFLIVGEHLLDRQVDSYNRHAVLILTNPQGKPVKRLPLEGYTHAAKIRQIGANAYVIAGNKRRNGASILVVNGNGEVLKERANVTGTESRPNSANSAIRMADGGLLVACKEGMRGFLTRLKPDLSTAWAKKSVDNLHYVKSAVEAPSGDCFMVGQFGPGKGIHIAQWNAKGNLVKEFVHRIDQSTNKGRRILVSRDGKLVLTGMVGSGGNGHFLFMTLDPRDISKPLVQERIDTGTGGSNYGQAITECRDGSFVIAGRTGRGQTYLLSMIRVDANGNVIAGPKFFGRDDPNSGEVGYDVIECADGSIAVIGQSGTVLQNGGKITDTSPEADFYLVKTKL